MSGKGESYLVKYGDWLTHKCGEHYRKVTFTDAAILKHIRACLSSIKVPESVNFISTDAVIK